MGLQDVIRWLLPKEDHFFILMEKQAATITRAALALARFTPGQDDAKSVARAVLTIEHQGDSLLHSVEEALAKTFVTPIDREDIQRLASLLDDVLDRINEAARAMDLYGLDAPSPAMHRQMKLLIETSRALEKAVPYLRQGNYEALVTAHHDIKKLEKDADTAFRDAVAALFRDDAIEAKQLLRDKEILTILEDAIDTCEDVAEFLANLAVKNG